VVPAGGDAAEANTVVVNHHYGLELSKVFGGGTMSSSDGQRFPVRGTSLSGRDMIIHRGRVLSTYTHVSDQWPTYGTKIIVPTAREAHFALDEFLGNAPPGHCVRLVVETCPHHRENDEHNRRRQRS
jgi:TnpA family transposase